MRPAPSNPGFLAAGIALTVAMLLGQSWLPPRTMELTRPGVASNFFLVGAQQAVEGQDEPPVRWVDVDRRHWRCHYRGIDGRQGCGLTFMLGDAEKGHGLDLSHFDTLHMELRYKGSSPFVRVALRNFDARFSKPEDGNSARMQSVNLRQRDVAKPVDIEMAELTVPEWWMQQFDLAREYNRPSLENVTSFTVDLPADLSGHPQDLVLRSLTLKGEWISRDRVYLGILCLWLLGASVLAMWRWQELRQRDRRQQREIDALTARTRQLRVEQDQLRRLATIDELTGVLNRRGLETALDDLEAQAETLGLVLLDIDYFKHINDRWGHAAGDEVLRRVAAIVSANLRNADVVGRWGGEEFLIVCRCRHIDEPAALADKLRAALAAGTVDPKGRFGITASFGVTLVPPGAATHRAFRRADAALYRAKEAGRNRVELGNAQDAATTM
ncbi:GGDEF domain-containing protein [Roseateles asaccharophilus]|uniref:diguanylate cyclase n=1 Tax=Roseateles asaccharophilus TaxID=582607 RepID=A0ABU2A3D9_9BURK|nr:GGDEF domain-containing protein [Roseateles asaccharophilus]MDR7331615.1 diguanylate cyclase (GGDEF)-like protein [Roseateles asaccharophilus]